MTRLNISTPGTTDAWEGMLKQCEQAKKSIDFEEYIFDPDKIGGRFVDILEQKAQEGIKVRLLLDWWGCKKFASSDMKKRLENVGVQIRFFNPFSWKWLISPQKFFPRDHRKVLIIDGKMTFAGGICVYDEITDWRDTMVEFSGGMVDQYQYVFNGMWKKVTGDKEKIEAHPDFKTTDGFSVFANAPDSDENDFTEEFFKPNP